MSKKEFDLGDISSLYYFFAVAVVLALLFSLIDGEKQIPFWFNFLIWLYQSLLPMALSLDMLLGFDPLPETKTQWFAAVMSEISGVVPYPQS